MMFEIVILGNTFYGRSRQLQKLEQIEEIRYLP